MVNYEYRVGSSDDALLAEKFFTKVNGETEYLLFSPDEVMPAKAWASSLEYALQHKTGVTYFCLQGEDIVGAGIAFRGFPRRQHHVMGIALMVAKDHHRQGIGLGLLRKLEDWAASHSIVRIELTVHAENLRAIQIYKRFGFTKEGVKRNSLRIDNRLIDEVYMAKCIDTVTH